MINFYKNENYTDTYKPLHSAQDHHVGLNTNKK